MNIRWGITNNLGGIVVNQKNECIYRKPRLPEKEYDTCLYFKDTNKQNIKRFVFIMQPKNKSYVKYDVNTNAISSLKILKMGSVQVQNDCNFFITDDKDFKKSKNIENVKKIDCNGIKCNIHEFKFAKPVNVVRAFNNISHETPGWYGMMIEGYINSNKISEQSLTECLQESLKINNY